ncbi:hypothetical protein M9458_051634, partial [Cirrhinus mrigala]
RKKQWSGRSFSAGSGGVTSAQCPHAQLSPCPPVSPVCFTQDDQHPSFAASGLVSFVASEEDVIIVDVTADNSKSLAASDAEEWGGSSGEPEALPSSQPVSPKLDAELVHVQSKAVEELGVEWLAPKEPVHGLLNEWYQPESRQQSSHQRSTPFLPAVHDELTKTWLILLQQQLSPPLMALKRMEEAVAAHLWPKATVQAIGKTMASLVVLERHLRLNLIEIRGAEKMAFLDSQVLPKGLFGPAVDGFAERFSEAQKTGPPLEEPDLVSRADAALSSRAMAHSTEEGSPLSGQGHDMASPTGVAELSCLVPRRELDQLSERVSNTILESRAPCTRQLYGQKCQVFSSWCLAQRLDPCSCDVSHVLTFLQQLLNKGRVPSTLKVYVAAIAALEAGHSLGRNDFIVKFLKGAWRLNPPCPQMIPSWDLSAVLRALKGSPSKPLTSADLRPISLKMALLLALASVKRVTGLLTGTVRQCLMSGVWAK